MADLRFITLTGTCLRGAGPEPAVGYVQIASVRMIAAPDADRLITTQPGNAILLDPEGKFSTQVVTGDDPSLEVQLLVEVRFLLEDTRPEVRVYSITTTADTIDIADCLWVPSVPPGEHEPMVPWSAVGRPGGVAPLGDNGLVPGQYLPPASGGLSHHHHEQNTPSDAWPVLHNLGYPPVFAFKDNLGRQLGAGWLLDHALDNMSTIVRWPAEVAGECDCS